MAHARTSRLICSPATGEASRRFIPVERLDPHVRPNLIVVLLIVVGLATIAGMVLARRASPARQDSPGPTFPAQAPAPRPETADTPGTPGGFWHWPAAQQEAWLTTAGADRGWSSETREFMRAAVRDRRLTPLARNNLAGGLLAQEVPFPGLVDEFVAMSRDASEQMAWRHYALQFAALSGGEREDVRAELFAVLEVRDGRAGTAALQLQRLAARGCDLPGSFADRIAAMAGDDTRLAQDRVAAMGVLSERDDPRCLPIARRLIASADPSLRRSAAFSLGRLGGMDDRRLLEDARNDPDESVADIARQALDRLAARANSDKIR